jgi:hypothetical protein
MKSLLSFVFLAVLIASASAKVWFFDYNTNTIYWVNTATGETELLGTGDGDDVQSSYTQLSYADGNIYYIEEEDTSTDQAVVQFNIDEATYSNLTVYSYYIYYPGVTADEEYAYFTYSINFATEIWKVAVDGSTSEQIGVIEADPSIYFMAVDSDGMLYLAASYTIYALDTTTSDAETEPDVTDFGDFSLTGSISGLVVYDDELYFQDYYGIYSFDVEGSEVSEEVLYYYSGDTFAIGGDDFYTPYGYYIYTYQAGDYSTDYTYTGYSDVSDTTTTVGSIVSDGEGGSSASAIFVSALLVMFALFLAL